MKIKLRSIIGHGGFNNTILVGYIGFIKLPDDKTTINNVVNVKEVVDIFKELFRDESYEEYEDFTDIVVLAIDDVDFDDDADIGDAVAWLKENLDTATYYVYSTEEQLWYEYDAETNDVDYLDESPIDLYSTLADNPNEELVN